MSEAGRSGGVKYQETVTIGEETYKIFSLSPSRAFKLAARLSKVIGEPMAAMAGAAEGAGLADAMQKAVKSLMSNLDEDRVLDLVKELVSCVEFHGQLLDGPMFEVHFKARLGHLMKLVVKVCEFQFEDFFSAIGQEIADAKGEKESQ